MLLCVSYWIVYRLIGKQIWLLKFRKYFIYDILL